MDSGKDILGDLTSDQREAVMHLDGPLLVLAGPGSGKTRVITRRVVHLLRSGVKPWNILAITFTNKAAGEMRKRVLDLVPNAKVTISTFHALGVRLLRKYADRLELDRGFTIYDQSDRNQLVKAAIAQANINDDRFTPDRVQSAISKAKNQLQNPADFARVASDFFDQTVARIYPLYERKLREANAMDFDDLLYWVAQMLLKFPDIRTDLDALFRYVMIDEYQDTNFVQYVIAKELAKDYRNICVVGDPNQGIYSFRGADISNILNFERDYPDAKVIGLGQNYRSTKNILRAAEELISHNRQRKQLHLTTANPEGTPVRVDKFPTGLEEAFDIALRIQDKVRSGERRYRDFAIFLRINAMSRAFEAAMIKFKVPHKIVRGQAFFDRKENKDVLAYLRLILNPKDDISFRRTVNMPPRGIGAVSLAHLEKYASEREQSLLEAVDKIDLINEIKGKAAKGLGDFGKLLAELRALVEAPPDEVIRQVLDKSGYRAMLRDSKDVEDRERLENIEELITGAQQFEAEDGTRNLERFLEHVTLMSDQDAYNETNDTVSIMTYHAAKGLEFPVVFMPAMENGILPHERSSNNPVEREEERRLTFVGITRAEEELFLSHADMREFRGSTLYAIPSPFLDELPQDMVQRPLKGVQAIAPVKETRYDRSDVDIYPDPDTYKKPKPAPVRAPAPPMKLVSAAQIEAPVAPKNPEEFVVGALVRHKVYGMGKITEASGHGMTKKVRVKFGTIGEKTFVLDHAPMEVLQRK
jgi:DNA helicase II / ATP-dependent DNA helicase PcrA